MKLPERIVQGDLLMRRWRDEDARALDAAINDSLEHLRAWMPWVAHEPLPLKQRRAMIARWDWDWRNGGELVFGLFVDGAVVGGCGLHPRVGPGALEIGYWVHVAHVRKGYATAAATGLTSLAFRLRDIHRVEIHHDKANLASEGVPRKLGFELIGEEPKTATAPRETGVHLVWRMDRTAWQRAH